MNELEEQQRNTLERMRESKTELLGRAKVKAYVDGLRTLLSKGTLLEQKAFLRSFVKRIAVDYPRVVLDYTIPLNAQKAEPLTREVLPFVEFSSPGRTRTSDQLVNSQPLYRLSYRGIGLPVAAASLKLYRIFLIRPAGNISVDEPELSQVYALYSAIAALQVTPYCIRVMQLSYLGRKQCRCPWERRAPARLQKPRWSVALPGTTRRKL